MSINPRKIISGILKPIPTLFRLLMGGMLINNGWRWIHRSDPGAYLTDALNTTIARGETVEFYLPFLERVVVPNAVVFAFLVSWGEFLTGLSLLVGAASRLGAGVISFQFINYGLMGGLSSLGTHLILTALAIIPVALNSGRDFGIDRWLFARWPKARIW